MYKLLMVFVLILPLDVMALDFIFGLNTTHLGKTTYIKDGKEVKLNERNGLVGLQLESGHGVAGFRNSYDMPSIMAFKTDIISTYRVGPVPVSTAFTYGLIHGYPEPTIGNRFDPLYSPSLKVHLKRGSVNLGLFGERLEVVVITGAFAL